MYVVVRMLADAPGFRAGVEFNVPELEAESLIAGGAAEPVKVLEQLTPASDEERAACLDRMRRIVVVPPAPATGGES